MAKSREPRAKSQGIHLLKFEPNIQYSLCAFVHSPAKAFATCQKPLQTSVQSRNRTQEPEATSLRLRVAPLLLAKVLITN